MCNPPFFDLKQKKNTKNITNINMELTSIEKDTLNKDMHNEIKNKLQNNFSAFLDV